MKRQTVVAGCIAGVVAACGGAAVDATGRTMIDAGDAIAGMGGALMADAGSDGVAGKGHTMAGVAGHAMAGAGAALAQAGRTLLGGRGGSGAGVSGTSGRGGRGGTTVASSGSVVAQEPTSDGLPRPHWVLRDKSGMPVEAEVGPGHNSAGARFSTDSPDFVWIRYLGKRRIEFTYQLATGQLARTSHGLSTFNYEGDTWREISGAYYLDAACHGAPYAPWHSFTALVAQTPYYSGGAAVSAPSCYMWSTGGAKCVEQTPSTPMKLWAWVPIPTDVVNLLPNAPYTMELAY